MSGHTPSERPDLCDMCGKPEPKGGWHASGCSDGDFEFFCSAECFKNSNDFTRDDEDIENG